MICGLQNRFVNIILLFIVVITNNKHWSVLNDLHHMSLNITFIKWKRVYKKRITSEQEENCSKLSFSYYRLIICCPKKMWSEIFCTDEVGLAPDTTCRFINIPFHVYCNLHVLVFFPAMESKRRKWQSLKRAKSCD